MNTSTLLGIWLSKPNGLVPDRLLLWVFGALHPEPYYSPYNRVIPHEWQGGWCSYLPVPIGYWLIDVPRALTPLCAHDASPFQCTLARNPSATTCISLTEVFLCTCGLLDVPERAQLLALLWDSSQAYILPHFPELSSQIRFKLPKVITCLIVHLHRLPSVLCLTPPLSYLCLVGSLPTLIICTGIFTLIFTPGEYKAKADTTLLFTF